MNLLRRGYEAKRERRAARRAVDDAIREMEDGWREDDAILRSYLDEALDDEDVLDGVEPWSDALESALLADILRDIRGHSSEEEEVPPVQAEDQGGPRHIAGDDPHPGAQAGCWEGVASQASRA